MILRHGWSWPVGVDPKKPVYFVVETNELDRSAKAARSAASKDHRVFECLHRNKPKKGRWISQSHLNRIAKELT